MGGYTVPHKSSPSASMCNLLNGTPNEFRGSLGKWATDEHAFVALLVWAWAQQKPGNAQMRRSAIAAYEPDIIKRNSIIVDGFSSSFVHGEAVCKRIEVGNVVLSIIECQTRRISVS